MSEVLTPFDPVQLYALIGDVLLPHLKTVLAQAGTGQRLRVSALPEPVMDHLCRSLQGTDQWCARVLTNEPTEEPWYATATKLIELRNSLPAPLIVFLPPGLRTAAEDSLDIATFHELPMTSLSASLKTQLLARLPEQLRTELAEVVEHLQHAKRIRNEDELVEYLLTVVGNGANSEAAGGALFCLGLVPDFKLFARGSTLFWLSRNIKAVEHLTAAQPVHTSVLRLPLKAKTVQKRLAAFLRDRSPRDVRSWAREIATGTEHRGLSLDLWEFADEGSEEELRLLVSDLSLPRQTEDKVGDAAQLRLLNLEGREPLTVSFRSIPPPSQAPAWKSWRVQLMAVREGDTAVAWESNNYAKPARHAKVSRKIKLDQLQGLEEGTYFYKVDAYDPDGALLTTPHRLGDGADGRGENESERFLIVSAEVPVEERDVRSKFVPALLDAWVSAAATALGAKQVQPVPDRGQLRGEWDVLLGAAPKGEVHFELKTEGVLGYSIVVPAMLRKLQREILEHPEQLGIYSVSFVDARRVADVELKPREVTLGEGPSVDRFLTARAKVFAAISNHHMIDPEIDDPSPKSRLGVVEVVDLAEHSSLITEYTDAYITLCREATVDTDEPATARLRTRALAQLDVVELRWRASPGDPGRALLVAPTHPLRLLWHLCHVAFCASTVQHWAEGTRKAPNFRALLEQILSEVLPINLPMVVFDRRGRGYVEQTPLTKHWSLYLPDRSEQNLQIDAVASRDRLLSHMGVRDRAVSVRTVDPEDVALRVYDYLIQHPYVEQLKLNVFNPGDGRLVADVLRMLEHRRQTDMGTPAPTLRYSIQMFASAEHVEGVGEGLEELLDPERQVAEDDEFTLASSNHLLPKLVFARNTVQEFLKSPKRFSAHVSLLLEQFIVQCRVGRIDELHQGAYVAGLVQEPETEVEIASGTHFGWLKGLNPRIREGADAAECRLVSAVCAAQRVQASFALEREAEDALAPVVALTLDASGQSLLKEVHEHSDWVLTLDRNLGLDYFDSPSSASSTGYLLDFAPEYLQEDRQRILLTTRNTVELEQIVRPVLNHYGLALKDGDPLLVLETLRSLSGRLALRLESGRTQAAEVVGLLLTRWLLERLGVLHNRVVIPLDAHRSWFDGGDATSRRRADLLLVGFQEPAGLQFDIVEVKLREELPDGARGALYAEMRRQTENTERRLRELFDLELYPNGRAEVDPISRTPNKGSELWVLPRCQTEKYTTKSSSVKLCA